MASGSDTTPASKEEPMELLEMEEMAAEAPAAPKRSSRAKKVMSGLLADDDESGSGVSPSGAFSRNGLRSNAEEGDDPDPDKLPTDDMIREKWPELVRECAAGKPRLENALANAALSFEEGDGFKTVSFEVTNEAQKKWIENGLLRTMENSFARILENGKVRLGITVKPSEEIEKKVYMPAEKAQELMNTNPEVLHLVKDLGLDAN